MDASNRSGGRRGGRRPANQRIEAGRGVSTTAALNGVAGVENSRARFLVQNHDASKKVTPKTTNKKYGDQISGTGRGVSTTGASKNTIDSVAAGKNNSETSKISRDQFLEQNRDARKVATNSTRNKKYGNNNKFSNKRKGNTSNPTNSPTVKVITTNFIADFHRKVKAAAYKVHAPNCTCPKVERIRSRYMDNQHQRGIDNTSEPMSQYNNGIQFDVDGGFTQQFEKKVQISNEESLFDNLVVLPDTQRPSSVYICKDTNSKQFQQNGTACEKKLAMEIFGSNGDIGKNSDNLPSFKVACAICLLTGHYWNGFVAILSAKYHHLQPILDNARDAAQAKESQILHSDHAHFVCALKISSLQTFVGSAKTRSASTKNITNVLSQLRNNGVELSNNVQNVSFVGEKVDEHSAKVELGHHLISFLHILNDEFQNDRSEATNSILQQSQYILVIGYQDGPFEWTLDLPGGKRHLGETTIEGAIREVEEECSLKLNQKWLEGQLPIRYGGIADFNSSKGLSIFEPNAPVKVYETSGNAFILISPFSNHFHFESIIEQA